ncbi:class I SAM-dependent methyltransferase [Thauera sp. AutoDN2]|uniref:class I SAM-dependent methyltransferase n=1 Tax=Thauera sp. AutoDN2 TaxID=3416051 RepID=UPI003F4C0A92
MKKPQNHTTYDEMFSKGGEQAPYQLPYFLSCYYPMYLAVLDVLKRTGSSRVLEVGCGTGGLAHLLKDRYPVEYIGIDFSSVAVEKAIKRTNNPDSFLVADALSPELYNSNLSTIVCTEVLEHIPQDLKLVELWPEGTHCICSVPNYDSQYHERFFKDEAEVIERYGELIEIDRIDRIKKPILENIAISNLLRHLRWNRYRPGRLLELLGFGDFDKVGGWFVFSGQRPSRKSSNH